MARARLIPMACPHPHSWATRLWRRISRGRCRNLRRAAWPVTVTRRTQPAGPQTLLTYWKERSPQNNILRLAMRPERKERRSYERYTDGFIRRFVFGADRGG